MVVSGSAVCSALVKEEDEKQHSMYYTSKALIRMETRYTQIENMALALVTAVWKLQPYFQSHRVIILTYQLFRQILQKSGASGRNMK